MPEDFQPAWQKQLNEPPIEIPRQGVGGWLFTFCITFTILGPLSLLRAIPGTEQARWVFIYVAITLLGMLAGITTWSRSNSAFTFVRLALVSRLLYGGFQLYSASHLQLTNMASDPATAVFTLGTANVVQAIVWFLYFRFSSRVELVFGRNI